MRFVAMVLAGAIWSAFCAELSTQEKPPERMPKGAHPTFEVATIKPANLDDHSSGFHLQGDRVFIENESVKDLLKFAYGLQEKQIVDGPPWMSDRFDIHGIPDTHAVPDFTQLQEMVQKLLAERFGLQFHRDKRELPIYTLTVTKGGPKLERSKDAADALSDETGNNDQKGHEWRYRNESMSKFAQALQGFVDRPVVDQTGLDQKYDFWLKWQNDLASTEDSEIPGLFTALQAQLGLKLTPDKGRADVLAIDHVERPTAN